MPTKVRLQHTDGRTVEMWLENDIVDLGRILINGKWFQAVDDNPEDATPTYKEEPTSEGDDEPLGTIKNRDLGRPRRWPRRI